MTFYLFITILLLTLYLTILHFLEYLFTENVLWKTKGNGISETQNLKIFCPFRPPVCTPAKSHTMPRGIKFDLNQ